MISFLTAGQVCFLILLELPTVVAVFVPGPSAPSGPLPRKAIDPWLDFHGCTVPEQKQWFEAWTSAGDFAAAHMDWEPGGQYQDVMNRCLGIESRNRGPLGGEAPFRENVLRQHGLRNNDPVWSPEEKSVLAAFYCDETRVAPQDTIQNKPLTMCKDHPQLVAYTWEINSDYQNYKFVVLCPIFFSLKMDLYDLESGPLGHYNDDIGPWLWTRANTILHETYHWSPEVSNPKCNLDPEVYDPQSIVNLADGSQIYKPQLNAESWTQAAISIYLMKKFSSTKVPMPLPNSNTNPYASAPPPPPPPKSRRELMKGGNSTEHKLKSPNGPSNTFNDYLGSAYIPDFFADMSNMVRFSDLRRRYNPHESSATPTPTPTPSKKNVDSNNSPRRPRSRL